MYIFAILVALAFLYNYLQINIFSFLIITIGIFVLFCKKYSFKKNPVFFRELVCVLFLSVAYSFGNGILENFSITDIDRSFIVDAIFKGYNNNAMIVAFVLLLLFYLDTLTIVQKPKSKPIPLPELFNERKRDLERLKEVFSVFNVVGVVGGWGSGKTLLTKYLESEIKYSENNTWNFIRINALALKLDKVELLVITELQKLLENNEIISKHAENLKNALSSSDVIKGIYFSIFSTELYADAIFGLKEDIIDNDLKVAIVVEDLDRVTDFKVIDNLFTMSSVLQNDSLKFIFEYNYNRLNALNNKFDREYLDKYIYAELFVTPVKFSWLLTRIINKNHYSSITEKDFIFLNMPVVILDVNNVLNRKFEYDYKLVDQPVRKVEHLLENINTYIEGLRKDNVHDFNTQAIIVFYILKFFEHETWYRLMENFTNVIDSFTFKVYNTDNSITEEMTLREILMRVRNYRYVNSLKDKDKLSNLKVLSYNEANEILHDSRNMLSFCVIGWLRYNVLSINEGRTYAYADERELKKIAYNEDVDAILRNLMWEGKNSAADIKLVIDNLDREVFQDSNTNNWLERYSSFLEGYFYSKFPMEQGSERTPFVIGINPLVTLFQCMSMYIGKYRDWNSLVRLLFINIEHTKKHNYRMAWNDIIKCLSIYNYDSTDTLKLVVTGFNKLDINFNPKDDDNYWKFLEKILEGFSMLGASQFFGYYAQQLSYFDPGLKKRYIDDIISNVLEPVKRFFEEAEEMISEITINDEANNDNTLFITFIENNIRMLRLEVRRDLQSPISTKTTQQVKRSEMAIQNIREKEYHSLEELKKALISAINNGEIEYYDAVSIIREWKREHRDNN